METQAKNRVYRAAAILSCVSALVTLTGCFGARSCQIASFLHENAQFSKTLDQLRKVSSIDDATKLCWHKVPLLIEDHDANEDHRNIEIPVEFGLELQAKDASSAADLFAEMSQFANGKQAHLSFAAQDQESLGTPSRSVPESEMKQEALRRMPIYKLHPQIKESALALQAFCRQTEALKSGKVDGVAEIKRLMTLRQKAVDKIVETRLLFSTPAVRTAAVAACQGHGTGENMAADADAEAARRGQPSHPDEIGTFFDDEEPSAGSKAGGAKTYPPCSNNPRPSPCSF